MATPVHCHAHAGTANMRIRIKASLCRLNAATNVAALTAGFLLLPATAGATDIFGVQNAALDQPIINALLRPGAGGAPLSGIDPLTGGMAPPSADPRKRHPVRQSTATGGKPAASS